MRLLGIGTLGQLAAVPQRLLVEQFGPAGRWYRLLARGIDGRRVAAWQPAPFMEAAGPVHDDEPTLPLLEALVSDLAGVLSERLVSAGLYARSVALIAHLEGGDRRFATQHLKAPVHLRGQLARTAIALLARIVERERPEDIANCNALRPCALELRVGGLGTRGVLQLSIFGETERGPALRATVARIQDRFGERAVRNGVQLMAETPNP
jgi:nucleotidyltransferase/DNA polymerase involved in DNA repair